MKTGVYFLIMQWHSKKNSVLGNVNAGYVSEHQTLVAYAETKMEEIKQFIGTGKAKKLCPSNINDMMQLEIKYPEKYRCTQVKFNFSDFQLESLQKFLLLTFKSEIHKYPFKKKVDMLTNMVDFICELYMQTEM